MGRDQQVLRKHHETRETRIGHLVHDTLYHWNAGSPETAMRKAMSGKDYSEEEADAAGHHLQAVRKCTRLQDWLSTASQYWKEQDLWHKGEQLRIDLLIRLQDRCIVIDYKTGGERSEYETRVRTYAAAVEAIFKIPVEAYLLYTDSGQIEQLA